MAFDILHCAHLIDCVFVQVANRIGVQAWMQFPYCHDKGCRWQLVLILLFPFSFFFLLFVTISLVWNSKEKLLLGEDSFLVLLESITHFGAEPKQSMYLYPCVYVLCLLMYFWILCSYTHLFSYDIIVSSAPCTVISQSTIRPIVLFLVFPLL